MANNKKHQLYIFDIDGTVAKKFSTTLMENVREWFAKGLPAAFATNQGGVGLRHWMESAGFGENPEAFPTEADVWLRLERICTALSRNDIISVAAFRYKSVSSGVWSPVPEDITDSHRQLCWHKEARKPSTAMVQYIRDNHPCGGGEILFVGDRIEDEECARRAQVDFMWAHEFFERPRQ